MALDISRLAVSVTVHAWDQDKTRIAVSPNNSEVHIYSRNSSGEYVLEDMLLEHDSIVTGIDWGHKTNRIVTCAQDRNAYVWKFEDGKWKPTLVILRINRAATKCKWSPKEDKFAVASGANLVSVCYFEQDNDWWVSKHIKKHRSTVLDIDWHPNNILLATGSSDGKARVVSAFVRGVDNREDIPKSGTAFGSKLPFGVLLKEIDGIGGWVHTVKWSPSGNRLGFTSHDSTVHVLECGSTTHKHHNTRYNGLPFRDFVWVSENSLIAVGHDCNPALFSTDGNSVSFVSLLDQVEQQKKAGGGTARSMFENMVDRGSSGAGDSENTLPTKHQNCIVSICGFGGSPTKISQFSTAGLDGNVVIWSLDNLKSSLKITVA